MENWAAHEVLAAQASVFPLAPIEALVTPRLQSTSAEKFSDLTPITVHLTGEISVRERDEPFQGAMFVGYPGDIVFSKIDARLGAIGVIPDTIGAAVVTAEYPVHTPNPEALDAEYLKLVLRTGHFISDLRQKASGTSGRKRVSPEAFRSLRVPRPSLGEQRAIVGKYREALGQAQALEKEAAAKEAEGVRRFETALGIVASPALPDRPLFVARFSDLDRWSHEAVLRRVAGAEPPPSPYPIVALEDVIADLENGWSPKCHPRPAAEGEWGVLKVGAVSTGIYNPRQNKALPDTLKPRPALEIQQGDLLIGRANIARLVGATVFVDDTPGRLMLCDKIFRALPLPGAPARFDFLAAVLKTPLVREQIEGQLTGSSPTMKNISKPSLLGLTFPMPTDLEVQAALVGDLSASQSAASGCRAQALEIRREAWRVFETAIYGDASVSTNLGLPDEVTESLAD
ncbi:hypothetical protein [Caulobacter sp. RL271]|uniref:Type I restriction modification DNA specificity domain-containing protein n=1 Tax=Caulobacter segnis TaxID=88688 RepID=A0ABY4ZTH8_9CAUL|nr:hypothetical protein [Caulobacter segnis]USQ95307.1 hypothetical protein MZV50_22595 [Caulobacter segnis]